MKTIEEYQAITDPTALFDRLFDDMLQEQKTLDDNPNFINLAICKIRAYNNIWNKICETRPALRPDAVKTFMKDACLAKAMPESIRRAAAYL